MDEQGKQSQETPAQQEITQEEQQVPTPPSSNPKLLISVVVLALIIAGGAGAYFFATQKSDTENVSDNIDRTADWKTYRNEEHGFAFSYDSSRFEFSERTYDKSKSSEVQILNTRIVSGKTEYIQKSVNMYVIPILSQEEKRSLFRGKKFSFLIRSFQPTSILNDLPSFIRNTYPYPVKLTTKTINGIEFIQVIREDDVQDDISSLVLYNVTPNNFIWEIGYYIDTDFIDPYGKDIDDIISTFTPI